MEDKPLRVGLTIRRIIAETVKKFVNNRQNIGNARPKTNSETIKKGNNDGNQ